VPPEGQSDFELIDRFLAGEISAFDALVQKYQQDVYRLAYRITLSADDAKDLAQETFLQAYRALKGFTVGRAFIHGCTVLLCISASTIANAALGWSRWLRSPSSLLTARSRCTTS